MSIVPSPHQEKEETISYLQRERDVWLGARELLAIQPDGETQKIFNDSYRRLNFLLEDLFRQQVVVELDYDGA